MGKLHIRIKPEHTGKQSFAAPENSPITSALQDVGFTKIVIKDNQWRGYKWGIIPVGGDIPWDTRVIVSECQESKQQVPIRITVGLEWFPNSI